MSLAGSTGHSGHLGDALSALLDGELTSQAAARAQDHLARCPACAAELDGIARARSWVRNLPPVEPPGDFLARLVSDLPAEVVPIGRRRIGVAVLAASAAAAAAIIGLVSPQEPATTPPVAHLVEAHATAVGGGDPVSQLVSAGVPVSFRR